MEKITIANNNKNRILKWAQAIDAFGLKVWARATGGNGYPGKEKYLMTIWNTMHLSAEEFDKVVNELTK